MANKQQVIDANRLHPDWTSKQIAIALLGINASEKHLNAINGWVRAVANREGLTLGAYKRTSEPKPSRGEKPPKPESIFVLGKIARALGFTVADLMALRQANPRPLAPIDASIEDIGAALLTIKERA